MGDLPAEVEQQLADLPEAEWATLVAKVRAPDAREAFRSIASQAITGTALDAITSTADLSKFANDSGEIDEEKVMGHLTAMFGTQTAAGEQRNWGQHSGSSGQGLRPGDAGRAEAARRAGRQPAAEDEAAAASTARGRGAGGREEAQRRFGKKGIDK